MGLLRDSGARISANNGAPTMELQQWNSARTLKRELNSLSSKRNDGNLDANFKKKFSTTYCFYAVLGGFVLDVSDIHDDQPLLTIQPLGIVELAEQGHFLEISENAIKDKSKADIYWQNYWSAFSLCGW